MKVEVLSSCGKLSCCPWHATIPPIPCPPTLLRARDGSRRELLPAQEAVGVSWHPARWPRGRAQLKPPSPGLLQGGSIRGQGVYLTTSMSSREGRVCHPGWRLQHAALLVHHPSASRSTSGRRRRAFTHSNGCSALALRHSVLPRGRKRMQESCCAVHSTLRRAAQGCSGPDDKGRGRRQCR